jgi:hypothetical protein
MQLKHIYNDCADLVDKVNIMTNDCADLVDKVTQMVDTMQNKLQIHPSKSKHMFIGSLYNLIRIKYLVILF